MSIYIRGLDIPQKDFIDVRIWPNGKAEMGRIKTATDSTGGPAYYRTYDVQRVPPHMGLIDRANFEVIGYTGTEGREDTFDDGVLWLLDLIEGMPDVVPEDNYSVMVYPQVDGITPTVIGGKNDTD